MAPKLRSAPKHLARGVTLLAAIAGIVGGTISLLVYLNPKTSRSVGIGSVSPETGASKPQPAPSTREQAPTGQRRGQRSIKRASQLRHTTAPSVTASPTDASAAAHVAPERAAASVPEGAAAVHAESSEPQSERPHTATTRESAPAPAPTETSAPAPTPTPSVTNLCSGNVTNTASGGGTAQGGNCSTNVVGSTE